jgi:hypothetical protein
MAYFRIWLLSIAAAILYGIAHDSITTRICVEYFTIAHPPIFNHTENPTLLAFGWGILATWWVGLGLGVPLSLVARVGSRPKLGAGDLARSVVILVAAMLFISLLAGIVGHELAESGAVWLVGDFASRVPAEKHVAFLAVAWAHGAAYLAGFLGGLVLWIWTWVRRWRLSRAGTKACVTN